MDARLETYTKDFLASRAELIAFINGMVRDLSVAEDTYQQVWLEISKAVEQGKTIAEPQGWFKAVAKKLILMHWRKSRTEKKHIVVSSRILELTAQAFATTESGEDHWSARRKALRRCIKTMPTQTRTLLEMKYDQGQPIKNIAERMKKTYSSIAMSLTRSRQQLRKCIEKRLASPEVQR